MAGDISFENPEGGEPRSSSDGKIRAALITIKEAINGGLNHENLVSGTAVAGKWYTSKVIATEESRTNTAFGTLTTADEIAGIVLPTNGLIVVGYHATWKSSVSAAGGANIFLGANQLIGPTGALTEPASTEGTELHTLMAGKGGTGGLFTVSGAATSDATTGQVASATALPIFAAAGTYTVSVRYKATSGSVTAKERKLWVYTLGE